MWLFPSVDPDRVSFLGKSVKEMGVATRGLILVNRAHYEEHRAAFESALRPPGWDFKLTESSAFADQIREQWDFVKTLPWCGFLREQSVILSPQWDQQILSSLMGWNFVSSNDDLGDNRQISGCAAWSGELLREVGFMFPDGMPDYLALEAWQKLGAKTGAWLHRMDVVVRNLEAPIARLNVPFPDFEQWQTLQMPMLEERVIKLRDSKGVLNFSVDWSGVMLMIAVPSGDGRFGHEFVASLHDTFQLLQQNNVPFEFVVEPNNPDIANARTKIATKFLHSRCNYLLMIDDDMAWNAQAIARLFAAKKEYVAVAGPKKRIPPQFAVTPLSFDKNYGTVQFDPKTGCCEVMEVGAAFTLLKREVFERLKEAYPELRFRNIGGSIDTFFFLPGIFKKPEDPDNPGDYKAEDYAFCRRWRDTGGKVYVCPDVSLKHFGNWTYQGAWTDIWPRPDAEQKTAVG